MYNRVVANIWGLKGTDIQMDRQINRQIDRQLDI